MNWQVLLLPNKTEFKQTGNLPGEQVTMAFDENSLAHLASVLINLYSDKELAVIREYSTNAKDSHIRAGQNRPIEITTPSYLSYFFRIKDWGVGLSADDIRKIYSKYGASTGRETNDQTGMYGLGCKSGLTYTDQFTIVAVKDGIKINVAVSRAVDGGGTMTILSETNTTDPNGVEIIIPVAKNNNFSTKAHNFFQYWSENEVLINGKPPNKPNLLKLTDRLYMKQNTSYYDKPIVVMGGISYEVDQKQIKLPSDLVAFVDMGAVSFPPSREYLQYTPTTMATLTTLLEEYKENLAKAVQKEIDSQTSKISVIKTINKWNNRLNNQGIVFKASDFTYKGQTVQKTFAFDSVWQYGFGFDNYPTNKDLLQLEKAVIVYGFEADKLTSYQRQKLNVWCENNGLYKPSFYFCDKVPGDGWLDEIKQLDWKEILAMKISRGKGQAKSQPTYEIYTNKKLSSVTELDATKPILYSTKGEWGKLTDAGDKVKHTFPDIQFVFIGKNRLAKFLEIYPDAKPLTTGLHDIVQEFIDNLTVEQKKYLTSSEYEINKYGVLNKSMVSDPDLIDIIESSKNSKEILRFQETWNKMCSMGVDLGMNNMYSMFSQLDRTKWVDDRYPILAVLINRAPYGVGKKYWNHVYTYINAAYQVYKDSQK